MADKLKRCPFCGGEATLVEDIYNDQLYNYVICSNDDCNANTGRCDTQDEAIAKWNKRTSPWHTGTPTEEGNYIAHLRIKSRDGKFIEYDMTCNLEVLLNYIRCQDESEENYLMVKGWLIYEPYKED